MLHQHAAHLVVCDVCPFFFLNKNRRTHKVVQIVLHVRVGALANTKRVGRGVDDNAGLGTSLGDVNRFAVAVHKRVIRHRTRQKGGVGEKVGLQIGTPEFFNQAHFFAVWGLVNLNTCASGHKANAVKHKFLGEGLASHASDGRRSNASPKYGLLGARGLGLH